MKRLITLILFLGLRHFTSAQNVDDTIGSRIVLIGDAGALVDGGQPVMEGVRRFVPLNEKTTVVYLGDNLYSEGLPDEQFENYWRYKAVLDTQVNLVNGTSAKAYFIPGNHDWMNGNEGGYYAILRQQRYIDQISKTNIKFYPEGGCPGPVSVNIGDNVVLVIMDSQWWLHPAEKPGIESDCPQKTKEEVLVELEDILSENEKKLVVFALHHPFKSNGIHGGFYTWKQHLFPLTDLRKNLYIPLPVLGSLYPVARGVFGTPQDLKHPIYQNMANRVMEVIKQHHHYTILAHGHEHNLQYFADSNFHTVVSGSGCKQTRVEEGRSAEFVSANLGFAVLEVSKNKNVSLSFYITTKDSFGRAWQKNILNFTTPPAEKDTLPPTTPLFSYRDSVLAPASLQYRKSGVVRRSLLGDNYRAEWSTPVMFKEFNIRKEKGGFEIIGRGGGKQTKSLTLLDKDGREWALRTLDKDAEKILPENLRNGPAQQIVQDMISASHPYAPLVVPTLAKAVGVRQADPEVFFIPDDPNLGSYRRLFANRICFLEQKDPVLDGVKTRSTSKVINHMITKQDHLVDQREVLKARILDILISDFDRHADQWKWVVADTGIGKLYKPIAKDRDQAFFYSDGEIMEWATRKRLPMLRGFRPKIQKVNELGFAARNFDRFFLNNLNENDWRETMDEFKGEMNDSIIDAAVKKLPKEIYPISGDTMAKKLKSRNRMLEDAVMKYYKFLAREVTITGSNKDEYFKVTGTDSGTVVKVYAKEPESDTSLLVYNRIFDPSKTKEIRLYGFNGNDKFQIEGKKGLRVRLIGGKGIDTFQVQGNMKTLVYDVNTEPNVLVKGERTKDRMKSHPSVNDYTFNAYDYDVTRFPRVNLGFNMEDGLLLGVGFWKRTHGFRKNPYESDNKLSTLVSAFNEAYNIRYRGEFNHLFRSYDVLINSDFYNPVLTNFFGLGNETHRDPAFSMRHYRVRYKYFSGDVQVRKRMFANKLGVALGPSFYHYWMREKDNRSKILEFPSAVGLDSASVYGVKTYLGGRLDVNVNNLNSDFYPTRGVEWNTQLQYFTGVNNNSTPLWRLQSDMTIYASHADYNKTLTIIKIGGGHIFNDNFEYFQSLGLGANNFLRGFRKNRFSGKSLAYGSVEVRYKLFDVRSPILPGSFGIVAFDDIGRVWMPGESSRKWHNTFGGGVFYLPLDLISISATVGVSEEETLFNFTVGTRLAMYF